MILLRRSYGSHLQNLWRGGGGPGPFVRSLGGNHHLLLLRETSPHVKHYCKGKMEDLKYVCEGCGRLATSPDLLCKPSKVPA